MVNILKQLQLISVILKGGSGSGNFGHAGIPGEVGGSAPGGGSSGSSGEKYSGGSGGKNAASQKTLESMTKPLPKSLKYDDEVIFLDSNNNIIRGQIAGFTESGELKLSIMMENGKVIPIADREKVNIPAAHVRMPKHGYRTRGE